MLQALLAKFLVERRQTVTECVIVIISRPIYALIRVVKDINISRFGNLCSTVHWDNCFSLSIYLLIPLFASDRIQLIFGNVGLIF